MVEVFLKFNINTRRPIFEYDCSYTTTLIKKCCIYVLHILCAGNMLLRMSDLSIHRQKSMPKGLDVCSSLVHSLATSCLFSLHLFVFFLGSSYVASSQLANGFNEDCEAKSLQQLSVCPWGWNLRPSLLSPCTPFIIKSARKSRWSTTAIHLNRITRYARQANFAVLN